MKPRKTTKKKPARSHAVEPHRSPAFLNVPCSTFGQGQHKLVLFHASAKQIYSVCVINQREEDKDEGYQRTLSPARASRIASFIDGGNLLPTSVLLSFGSDTTLAESGTVLRIPNKPDAGWIIDGQHRLEGAHKATKDVELAAVAFIGLPLDDQINCFVTINREQKGVPSSLYFDLLKHLPPKQTEAEATKERAADLGQIMKRDEQSAFYAKIVATTSPKQGELSLTNFVRKIAPLVRRDGRLSALRDEDRQRVIDNYYRALEQVFPHEYKKQNCIFFKTLGFGALMSILPTVLDVTLNRSGGGFTTKDASETLKLIAHVDFGSWHERGTGTQVEAAAADDLRTELLDHIQSDGAGIMRLR